MQVNEAAPTAYGIVSEAHGYRSREEVTTDHAAAMVVGTLVGQVTADGTYKRYDPDAVDGREEVAGILLEATPIGGEFARTILARDAEYQAAAIVHPSGASAQDIADAEAALADLGIVVRT